MPGSREASASLWGDSSGASCQPTAPRVPGLNMKRTAGPEGSSTEGERRVLQGEVRWDTDRVSPNSESPSNLGHGEKSALAGRWV